MTNIFRQLIVPWLLALLLAWLLVITWLHNQQLLLSDNGYVAIVFSTAQPWLVRLILLALLTAAMAFGLLLSVGAIKRGQLQLATDAELLAHHLKRLQNSPQQCQISESLVPLLKPAQQAFNELSGALEQNELASEQLVQQLNQQLQQCNAQLAELEQQHQQLTTAQQLQQRQIRHWFEQSQILWQRRDQLQPLQLQRLLQLHLLAGHYQFSAADPEGPPVQLGSWLGRHLDDFNELLPAASVVLDWQEHPDNLAYSVNICDKTLKSLLQALIMLCLRSEDVSKISVALQLQVGEQQSALKLTASCNGNGLPGHCRQLLHAADLLDLQWSDADVALLKAIQITGGEFSAQSLDGLGCILQLTIPVQTSAEKVSEPASLRHILVVDDNETNLAFVQVLLKNKPLVLHTATSAAQVFSLCQQQRFDMILLDIQLPDMSGVDIAKQLRQMPQFRQVPIVAFTAHAMPAEIETYRDAGMDDIVFKPLEPARLDSLLAKFSLTPR
ncbi:response regulator [Arsukibacterium perlucidum]|uniref:response regulator n=1 Tax=Arsukibacterium perlucidum TaxID=368811 RepID=UPI0003773BF6|nr:response regulator [Arsukibacterium perlucidum]